MMVFGVPPYADDRRDRWTFVGLWDWTFCDAEERGICLRGAPQSGGGEELQPGRRHRDSGILDVGIVAGFEEAMDFIGTRESGPCAEKSVELFFCGRTSRLDSRLRPPHTDKIWDINGVD